jgi:hypothetical protein
LEAGVRGKGLQDLQPLRPQEEEDQVEAEFHPSPWPALALLPQGIQKVQEAFLLRLSQDHQGKGGVGLEALALEL